MTAERRLAIQRMTKKGGVSRSSFWRFDGERNTAHQNSDGVVRAPSTAVVPEWPSREYCREIPEAWSTSDRPLFLSDNSRTRWPGIVSANANVLLAKLQRTFWFPFHGQFFGLLDLITAHPLMENTENFGGLGSGRFIAVD